MISSKHSLHVAIYALNIGHKLNYNTKSLQQLGISALLHDLGFKRVDKNLIQKESALNEEEIKEVQKHSRFSVEFIRHNNITDPKIIDAILHHHEQDDGKGYPDRLSKDEISDSAAILFICDVFDALTTSRPYRKEYSSFEAIKYMIKDPSMSHKFNHRFLELFLKSL